MPQSRPGPNDGRPHSAARHLAATLTVAAGGVGLFAWAAAGSATAAPSWPYVAAGLSFLISPLAWRGIRGGFRRTVLFGAVWLALWCAAATSVGFRGPSGAADFDRRFAALDPGLTPSEVAGAMGSHRCFFTEHQFTPPESRADYTGWVRVLSDAPDLREGWVVFRDGRVVHTETWPHR